MMRRIGILGAFSILALCLIFPAACRNSASSQADTNGRVAGVSDQPVTIDSHRSFRVEYKSEPEKIEAGKPAVLSFSVRDQTGAPVKELQIVHEKLMHVLVVSNDLAEFYHIHPEPAADGSYRVPHVFPNGGDYTVYSDFTPKGALQVVDQININVAGAARMPEPLVEDKTFEKIVGGLRVVMKPAGAVEAGKELTLAFQAFDASSGKPAVDLQNYLGELAHFVIVSEDREDFVHAHPMAKGEKMTGQSMAAQPEHKDDGHSHSAAAQGPAGTGVSEVFAHTAFPRPGLYKIWAQFQRNNKVITVPFTVRAGGETAQKSDHATAVPPGAVLVSISDEGYRPGSIMVRKGEPVKLAFRRTSADNCGGEVTFPKLGITRKMPVGETVVVEFTPTDAGEIAFACGMGMMKGKVLVQQTF